MEYTGINHRQGGAIHPIIDRRVHAECGLFKIVRLNRAGKWYYEYWSPSNPLIIKLRTHVKVAEAARLAANMGPRGIIYYGLHGGGTFDRLVQRELSKRAKCRK